MYVVFKNHTGWPDCMDVRDQKHLEARMTKLELKGYPITVLSVRGSVQGAWDVMLKAQQAFKKDRYDQA